MKKLIVNADDFGVTKSVNEGIIYGFKNGIITSTSLMVNRPYAQQAAQLAKDLSAGRQEIPGLGLGLHFEIISDDNQVIRGAKKVFAYLAIGTFQVEKVKKQFFKQIEKFKSLTGRMPDHIDGHYHVHKLPRIFPFINKFSNENNIPMRATGDINFIDLFSTNDYEDCTIENLIGILRTLPEGVSELMTHSGFNSAELGQVSSMSDIREKELNIITSPEIKKVIQEEKIQLIRWDEI